MSEEEIEAIQKVKEVIKIDKERRIVTIYDEKPLFRDQLQTLIDLIDKQQKEIEKLNFENCISKEKIREKIKELEKANNQNKIMSIQVRQHGFSQKTIEQYVIRATVEILKELLEEN